MLKQIFLPLLAVIGLDQFTKYWATHSLNTAITLNTGIIAGAYSHAPQLIKTLMIFAIFFIVTLIYIFLQFLFFKHAKTLSILISVLIGAFGSNLIDKFRLGGAIDFIPVSIGSNGTLVFNVADFIQQITLVFLFAYFIKNREKLWPLIELRKTWVIDKSFQLTSAFFTALFSLTTGISVAILAYLFFVPPGVAHAEVTDLQTYFFVITLFLASFFLLVFIASVVFFNRAAGPVYSASRFIDKMTEGDYGVFKLRQADYFRNLEASLNKLSAKLRQK